MQPDSNNLSPEQQLADPVCLCHRCRFFARGWDASRSHPAEPDECCHPKVGNLMTANMKRGCIQRCKGYESHTPILDPWVMFTKRTNDPKLSWLERQLDKAGIPHRRHGRSWHARILEVPKSQINAAWKLLPLRIDDLPDDSPHFRR